jgi:DNA-binding HxlR family transcriptional regulator
MLVNCKYIVILGPMALTSKKKSRGTKERSAPRSHCAIGLGLDLLGDRWSLLIIRDLMFTNRNEYGQLLRSGEGIATNVLAERLARLETSGIVSKTPHPEHGKKFVYTLTERGKALAPVLIEFALWSRDTIADAVVPDSLYDLMVNDREGMLASIGAGEPLLEIAEIKSPGVRSPISQSD